MRIRLVIVGLFFTAVALGQENDSLKRIQHDSIRATNIQSFPDHFFIWPVIKQRSLSFEVQNNLSRKEKLIYKPNNAYTLGLGAYVFDLGLELTFAIPIDEKNHARFGSSSARDFQINALGKKWGADFFYQKYNHFYIDDPNVPVPPDDPFPQRNDINTRNLGISGIYIFNDTRFSFKSAYNFAERQLKSSGSFLLIGTINSFKVNGDSSVVSDQAQTFIGQESEFKTLKHTTFSISPGYAYNFIYKDFFLNTTLFFGPAHNWIYFEREDGSTKNDTNINAFVAFRIGIGYNSDKFFTGLNFVTQSRSAVFEDIRFTNSTSTFRFLVGYRFREFGILKRSVKEIPSALGF